MEIYPLTQDHAKVAARLHIAGQPGTFLTSLGPDVLAVLYQALPQSPVGFGFAATDNQQTANQQTHSPANVAGFVSATTSIGSLLVEMGTRRIGQFLPPLLKRFARNPQLAIRSVQTVLYPFLSGSNNHSSDGRDTAPTAELLSIMVEPNARSQGIGTRLLDALFDECQARAISLLDVTVDASNAGAQRFYLRHGFTHHHDFMLYGRAMCSLRRQIHEGVKTA